MSRKRATKRPEESYLFDLPLEPEPSPPAAEEADGGSLEGPPAARENPGDDAAGPHGPEPLELFTEAPEEPAWETADDPPSWNEATASEVEPSRGAGPSRDRAGEDSAAPSGPPGPFDRLRAGLVDLGVIFGVVLASLLGATLMGVDVLAGAPAALGLFALVFSFLFFTLPLAFWGRTPGMALTGQVARNEGDRPLTFAQTFLRWLGAIATTLAAGLPLLIAITGASLSDRISGSRTAYRG